MQTKWKAAITPVINNEINQGSLIEGVALINGATVINHLLGRQMVGWMIVDINAAATVYRSAGLNDKTLTLTSDAIAIASVWDFR